MPKKTSNDLFHEKFGRDLPATDERSPNYDYKAKLAMRREAMEKHQCYIEECKRRYPGGSPSK